MVPQVHCTYNWSISTKLNSSDKSGVDPQYQIQDNQNPSSHFDGEPSDDRTLYCEFTLFTLSLEFINIKTDLKMLFQMMLFYSNDWGGRMII
jgi:hypothetical protein